MVRQSKGLRFFVTCFAGLLFFSTARPQETKRFEYAILVDSTGSMRSQIATVTDLAKALVHQIHQRGPVSIYSFDSEGIGRGSRAIPASRIDRSRNEDSLTRTIDRVYIQGGQTTLLDAVELMAEQMNRSPMADEKIVILITDGEDRVSQITLATLIKQLTSSRTHVYAIGLAKDLQGRNRSTATEMLKSLTKETGGRAVFPKSVDAQNIISELAIPIQ